jgi:streptogrisin C
MVGGVALAATLEGTGDDDTLTGTGEADSIRGYGGADTIVDGPEDDAALDRLYGGAGADDITSANSQAFSDVVYCGGGTDRVVADALDRVDRATCENVQTVSDDALPEDAKAYAAQYGVSAEEALRRLELQEDVGELGAALEANEAETYGNLEILHEPEFRVVAYFTRDGEQTIRRYVQGTPLEGIVDVRQVGATLAELEAAQAEAMSYYEAQGVRFESGIDVGRNRAEIYLPPGARERLDSTPQAQAARELPAPAVEVAVESLSTPMAYMYGGRATDPCTSGFTVKAKTGNEGFVTAGHCDPGGSDDPNKLKFDGRVMPFKKQNIRDTHDVQWHTSPRPYDERAWFLDRNDEGSAIRKVRYVRGRDYQQVGEIVCKAGKATNHTCGEIVDRSYRPSYVGDADATFIRVERGGSGNMLGPGDSGAPVFTGNTALGIAVAGIGDPLDMIYMPINYVADSDLGIRRLQTTR